MSTGTVVRLVVDLIQKEINFTVNTVNFRIICHRFSAVNVTPAALVKKTIVFFTRFFQLGFRL